MENKKVVHFVFCEDRYEPILTEQGKINQREDPGPFACDMIQLKQPILLIADVLHFDRCLMSFDESQQISVWVHRQANNKKEGQFGTYKGEEMGEALHSKYPKLKFKYVTRAANPQPNVTTVGKDNNKMGIDIIEKKHLIEEFDKQANWHKISDFKEVKSATPNPKEQSPSVHANTIGVVNIIGGDVNTQNIDVKNQELTNTLKAQGVLVEDIAELLEILKSDNQDSEKQEFGVKTGSWMKKMISKAQDGTWAIGVGAAGKLLADAIKGYLEWS
jgi:hypothetical protein